MAFLVPIGNDVIIHPIEHQEMIGSLYIPDPAKKRINQGIIVAKGPACKDTDVEIADHVLFSGYTGDQVTLEESGQFYVIPETHVIAVLGKSNVRLMDTETIKRIIQERFGEKSVVAAGSMINSQEFLKGLEQDLLDRIDTFIIAEGFEF